MAELLDTRDLVLLLAKTHIAMGGTPELTSEMFETWGLNPQAVAEVLQNAAKATMEQFSFSHSSTDYTIRIENAMFSTTVVGFILGCMAMMEVETRRQTNEQK